MTETEVLEQALNLIKRDRMGTVVKTELSKQEELVQDLFRYYTLHCQMTPITHYGTILQYPMGFGFEVPEYLGNVLDQLLREDRALFFRLKSKAEGSIAL